MTIMQPRHFPQGFLWGTATSAHQVEGRNNNNQWWEWEQQPGRIWHGDRSGAACDWWHNAEQDLARAAALGQNAHRLSLEWSRIEPVEGIFDQAALARYRAILSFMHERGLTPMITLHHFTNPRWLEHRGGWLHPATPLLFGRFVRQVVGQLGDLCRLWCTINEPVIYAVQSYMLKLWPPGQGGIGAALRVVAAMLHGHALAAQALAEAGPQHQVGLVHQLRIFEPASPASRDVAVAALWDYLLNRAVLRALHDGRLPPPFGYGQVVPGLRGSSHFLGLNYYTRERVAFDPRAPGTLFGRRFTPPEVEQGDTGFEGRTYGELYPDGLYRTLRRSSRELGLPIYVTEIGLPDHDDDQRPGFLLNHLGAIHRAIADGVDVRGVFVWTLVDNFEWAEGWGLRFGLYALDQHSGARRLRPSGALYAAIARANALPAKASGRV